ncbi:Uu.00g076500.m01.CDS01 [Anthostomella pinea]|uniref:Uu.00g076500.m01.CDS01 n=1 Tax=Anthostomella pinea TaxID=933095 RepID=A0AAI8VWG2_9PEZI|nr:Uu.00g076500.m01.CDS01 [Anthostomella pinea]
MPWKPLLMPSGLTPRGLDDNDDLDLDIRASKQREHASHVFKYLHPSLVHAKVQSVDDDTKTIAESALQQKYIDLLEKRISQLELAVNETASKTTEDSKDDTKWTYVVALREWDNSTASYKDKNVAESLLKKEQLKDVAYVYRRVVYGTYSGEKRAYSEIELEDPKLVQLLKSEIDNKYPGVNFDGNTVYMQAPFPAIIHNWDKLRKRTEREPDSQACKDLTHLLDRIETADELEDYFKAREANMSSKVTTFETLWTLFPPKALVVVKPFNGVAQLLQVSSPPIPFPKAPIKNI